MVIGATYRGHERALVEAALPHLAAGGEALNLALVLLDDARAAHGTRAHRIGSADRVQAALLDACAALSRARVFEPRVVTFSTPILLAGESDPDAELARLHRLVARLAWANHELLPTRTHAAPLGPAEEASLQRVQETLLRASAWSSSIVRARPFVTAAALVLLAPLFGPLSAVAGIAVGAAAGVRELFDATT